MNILQIITNIIYPQLCFACRDLVAPREVLCLTCIATIKPVASRIFPIHGRKELVVHALGAYDAALQKLVTAKFRRSLPAACATGRLMAKLLPEQTFDIDYIVPVPLHWWRYANRGYNQAVEIAKSMSEELGIPYKSLLIRRRFTKFQYLLSRKDRQANIDDVFMLRPDAKNTPHGCRILLVDDLCTSGVTLQAAAHALADLKPSNVAAAVCARALF